MRSVKNKQAGYSLIEVLTAFALLSFAISTILPVFSNSLRVAKTVETRTLARLQLESLLSEVGTSKPLIAGDYVGVFDNGMAWTITVTPQQAAQDFTLFHIETSVSWRERGKTNALNVKTLRIGPTGALDIIDETDGR